MTAVFIGTCDSPPPAPDPSPEPVDRAHEEIADPHTWPKAIPWEEGQYDYPELFRAPQNVAIADAAVSRGDFWTIEHATNSISGLPTEQQIALLVYRSWSHSQEGEYELARNDSTELLRLVSANPHFPNAARIQELTLAFLQGGDQLESGAN